MRDDYELEDKSTSCGLTNISVILCIILKKEADIRRAWSWGGDGPSEFWFKIPRWHNCCTMARSLWTCCDALHSFRSRKCNYCLCFS